MMNFAPRAVSLQRASEIFSSFGLRILGILLIYSASMKLANPELVSHWISAMSGLRAQHGASLAFTISGLEFLVGLMAVLRPRQTASGVLVMFSIFMGIHSANLMGVFAVSCPCFGGTIVSSTWGMMALSVLAVVCCIVLILMETTS